MNVGNTGRWMFQEGSVRDAGQHASNTGTSRIIPDTRDNPSENLFVELFILRQIRRLKIEICTCVAVRLPGNRCKRTPNVKRTFTIHNHAYRPTRLCIRNKVLYEVRGYNLKPNINVDARRTSFENASNLVFRPKIHRHHCSWTLERPTVLREKNSTNPRSHYFSYAGRWRVKTSSGFRN